jgi:3',5'-cyclic AMP phosphodiesterase CpdA
MTRFFHITDLHVTARETEDPTRQTDTIATLARLVEIANRMRPDFVCATGDLTNIGDEASYRVVARMLGELEMPVICTLGNHDRRAGFHAAFADMPNAPDGSPDQDRVLGGHHVIALDSSVPGRVAGALDDAQFDWLAGALDRHPDLPKIVMIHHPPKMHANQTHVWAYLDAAGSARLGEMLAGRNIRAILSGHVHYNRMSLWRGIPLVVNNGLQSGVDLTRTSGLAVVEGTGFAICDVTEGDLSVAFVPLEEPRLIKEISEDRLRAFS